MNNKVYRWSICKKDCSTDDLLTASIKEFDTAPGAYLDGLENLHKYNNAKLAVTSCYTDSDLVGHGEWVAENIDGTIKEWPEKLLLVWTL